MKQAVLLLSNRHDISVSDKYNELKSSCKEIADVYLLYDMTAGFDSQKMSCFDNIYTFDTSILSELGYYAFVNKFDGNCHFPVLKFYFDNASKYDYVWVIEDDVVFTGDWSMLFNAFFEDDADLVASFIRPYSDDKLWPWWDSLGFPDDENLDIQNLYASFNPVYRLSSKAIKCLDTDMRRGWCGHFEATIPTILKKNDLKIKDINKISKFYTENSHSWLPLFVQDFKKNTIYHPVKEKITSTQYRKNCLISIVGQNSNHKKWLTGGEDRTFDLHLIVYDLSFGKYYDDADFMYYARGKGQELVYDYFKKHRYLLEVYDFFFIIDENCGMEYQSIEFVFEDMNTKTKDCSLQELFMPCISKEMMKSLISK